MPSVIANGINIEYEISGPENGPAVLLVMGLAAQLTFWPDALLERLNAAGYRTIRFDNRDIGKSEKMHASRTPNPVMQLLARRVGFRNVAAYSLTDMAQDSVSLLDALGIEKAHIVGVSMGGIISQIIAGKYPSRALSLTPIMSTTNNPRLPRPKGEVAAVLFRPQKQPLTREEAIQRSLKAWDIIGTKDSGAAPEEMREKFETAYDRGYYPAGVRRQLCAIIETADVRKWSRKVTAPTMVIHGEADPLVPLAGGHDIAKTIKDAQFNIIPGMGHDLPKKHIGKIADLMIAHFGQAQTKRAECAA